MKETNYPLFVKADVDAFFGLLSDSIAKVLIIIGVMIYSFNAPASLVYGKVLPGIGIGTAVGAFFYANQAKRLSQKLGRTDITAQPYGLSSTHVFVWLFSIMGPVYWTTDDPILAWQIGLAACVIGGVIEMLGSLYGEWLRKITPRAALLGSLAGVAITYVGLSAMLDVGTIPKVTLIPVMLVFIGFFAKDKLPFGLPAGIGAVLIGTILAWLFGYKDITGLASSFEYTSIYFPVPVIGDIVNGFRNIGPFLAIIIPIELHNTLTTLQSVEAANAAGDPYNAKETMIMDGIGTCTSALFGSPFPTTVYIGHPTWKEIGAGRGYMIMEGIFYLVVGFTGLMGVVNAIVPYQVAMVFLLFIGLTQGAQAFTKSPKRHAPAVWFAVFPAIIAWTGKWLNKLGDAEAIDGISTTFRSVGNGYIVISLIWGALLAFIIDRRYKEAAVVSAAATVLSAIGFIHAVELGFFFTGTWTIGYLFITILLGGYHAWQQKSENAQPRIDAGNEEIA
jgi:AGZA family xanthine/uracil permease-like MFS transporter